MVAVKRILISGFRGILAPLTIDLTRGAGTASVVIYGRNGTGKSSVTDAWEWFHSGRIHHLGREGAGHSAYPHREAAAGTTFVEIEFSDAALATVRVQFDSDRTTVPITSGNIGGIRRLIHHPCHVTFSDLTQFVYQTKAERYDHLAALMGFTPQVDFQKALRRIESNLTERLDRSSGQRRLVGDELKRLLALQDLGPNEVASALSPVLARHGLKGPLSIERAREGVAGLKGQVEQDPIAQQLAALKALLKEIHRAQPSTELSAALGNYVSQAKPFKHEEETLKQLLLIDVYRAGSVYLTQQAEKGVCPLCHQRFPGDLRQHIADELSKLERLRVLYKAANDTRKAGLTAIRQQAPYDGGIEEILQPLRATFGGTEVDNLVATLKSLAARQVDLVEILEEPPEAMDEAGLERLKTVAATYQQLLMSYASQRAAASAAILKGIAELDGEAGRKALVNDFALGSEALRLWDRYKDLALELVGLVSVAQRFGAIVNDFVASSIADVERRFSLISNQVTTFFETLEKDTPGIGKPVLKILLDQDRAVVPEVMFHGQRTSPAYKYLSESQLNSFGLAVFLASVRQFNPDFRFVILDDVVNSLDGYKRPQLIKLLKSDFADTQIILLTHDFAWRDRVYKELPSWKRVEFIRFDFGTGPVQGAALETLEEVKQFIHDDKPVRAGQALGPYMEFQLQKICEAFEVELKYNRRNEFTLEPLLDGLRVRVNSKLGSGHRLAKLLGELQVESGFRNLCAHGKDPAIQLTHQEMSAVLDKWVEVERTVRCQHLECFEILHYTDQKSFRCACGKTELKRSPGT